MQCAYFDAVCAVCCFLKGSNKDPKVVRRFQRDIIRLFSLINALCYSKLEGPDPSDLRLATLQVIDLDGLDARSMAALKENKHHMVMVVYCWIQSMVTDALNNEIINVTPPVSARIFAKLSEGLLKFENCRQVANIPFPYPYAQITLWLLVAHLVLCPFFMCHLVTDAKNNYQSIFLFTFLQVFLLWSIVLISSELENPFGEDANDLPITKNQDNFNDRLLILSKNSVIGHSPHFRTSAGFTAAGDENSLENLMEAIASDSESDCPAPKGQSMIQPFYGDGAPDNAYTPLWVESMPPMGPGL
jgi:hypothetical protein